MKMPGVFLAILMMPVSTSAQSGADSFQELEARKLLREGETIVVTYSRDGGDDHAVARGSFVRFTGEAIEIRLDSEKDMELAENDVRQIERERRDSFWKGAFIGAGTGLGFGAFSLATMCNNWSCDSRAVAGALVGPTAIGFATGAVIDAAVGKTKTELVYLESRPDNRAMNVSVSAIVSKAQKGVRVTVTW